MKQPVWRRRLAMILDRDWTEPLPVYTYLIARDEGHQRPRRQLTLTPC
jgi:hypothetical protein